MKKLLIMRGPQGVGKTSFLNQLGLSTHSLSSDALRLAIAGPIISPRGEWGITQENNVKVWTLFHDFARQRMSRGETLALDAMFVTASDIAPFKELAVEFGYDLLVADFSTMDFNQAWSQNLTRPVHARVTEGTMKKTFEKFAQIREEDLASYSRAKWDVASGNAGLQTQIEQWLQVPLEDLSTYKNVVHIGDLQGCLTVLTAPGGPFEKGFDPQTRYVFVGDLVDRGIENGILLKWLIPHVLSSSNIDLIWGNHEDHLFRFGQKQEAFSKEFRERTLPQLLEAGVTPEDVAKLLAKAKPMMTYQWNGQKVVVTHAGLPGLPPTDANGPLWHLLSMQQLNRGSGHFSDPIDQQWQNNTEASGNTDWIQVHGHRNNGYKSIQATKRSFNLEDEVEFGGQLRVVTLNDQGWIGTSYRNHVYATWRSRFEKKKVAQNTANMQNANSLNGTPSNELSNLTIASKNNTTIHIDPSENNTMNNSQSLNTHTSSELKEEKDNASNTSSSTAPVVDKEAQYIQLPIPAWIRTPSEYGCSLPPDVLSSMRAHSGVLEKPMPTFPHISSLNFTRDVFFDKKWDDVVVKARGLFFNTETGEIVARGYEKFFNIEERPETTMVALETNLKFPVKGYVKENGYLGNLGYDAKTDSLFVASKSTASGDFAAWFKEIFDQQVPSNIQDRIRRYLRDAEASMVFEVIDPIRDPHMIDYASAKLVLLDVFHRSSDSEKLPFDDLQTVGKQFGIEVKRRAFEFKTYEALKGWFGKATKDLSYRHTKGEDIEGIVFEDSAGFQTKAKLPHYSFWKKMRSTKDRYMKLMEKKNLMESDPKGLERHAQAYQKVQHDLKRAMQGDTHPLAVDFMQWCSTKPLTDLQGSILTLRQSFSQEFGIKPEHLKVRWTHFDPSEKEPVKAPKVPLGQPRHKS